MRQTIPDMQTMQLLASGGVMMAAGAIVSLSVAVSPPLTVVPSRLATIDVNGNITAQRQRTTETVGAAIDDRFERRWQTATDDLPPMPTPRRDLLEGLVGGLLTVPAAQDAPQDAPQVTQVELQDLAAAPQPEQQESVMVVPQQRSARTSDVCARHGLRRVSYTENHHRYWRCASGRRG